MISTLLRLKHRYDQLKWLYRMLQRVKARVLGGGA